MTRSATVPAFAKINLGLRILFRRPDEYHELRTVFQTISLADRLTVSFTPGDLSSVTVDGMPEVADNLAGRAAWAVLARSGAAGHVRVAIEKRIPLGAGLGGGSSDAAAVLLALPALTGIHLSLQTLFAVAAGLGSDVPFFLLGGTALGLGRGEEIYPLPDWPATFGVLLTPGIHVSTPDAYRALSPLLGEPAQKLGEFAASVAVPLASPLVNDFEPVVFALHPQLAELKAGLLNLGASQALMSGSGSSLFGLFNQKETVPGVVQFEGGEGGHAFSLLTRSLYRSEWNRHLQPHIEGDSWPPQSLYAQ